MADKKVHPYQDEVQKRTVYGGLRTYEYLVPFNYDNINVVRIYDGGETHGMELNPINAFRPDPSQPPADYIEVIEQEPIIQVEVIGSACTPPGYIQLMFEPCDGFYRNDEAAGIIAPRMRIDNLWGMHLRVDQYCTHTPNVTRYEGDEPYDKKPTTGWWGNWWSDKYMKTDNREFPLIGFSCGVFSVPRAKSVKITGGGQTPGWVGDNYTCDNHYSFRIIRTTVCTSIE